MPFVPAFCNTCGTAFPSPFDFKNAFDVTLTGVSVGPCPKCGGTGHVPDGVFNFVNRTIEVLSAPQRTVEELTRFVQILREAKENQQSTEQVAAKIKSQIPSLASVADLLPKNRVELYSLLAVVVAALPMLTQTSPPSPNVTINVTQIVDKAAATASAAKPTPQELPHHKKIGRNERCPCGSGKKYKKCHGALK